MMGSVSLNSFQNQKNDIYRWPALMAILLHIVFFGLLLSHFSIDPATDYTQTPTMQASLVSSKQLAAMMATHIKSEAVHPPTPVKPQPPIKPPLPTPPEKPLPTAIVKTSPAPQKIPVIKKIPPTQPKNVTQKSVEESLLQTELNKTETPPPKEKPKKITNTAIEEQMMAEQLQAEATNTQASTTGTVSSATTGTINQYKALILQQIQQNWIVPQKATNLSCILQIELAPGGMVLNVTILKSSGNDALDRSAIAAVNKSSPLPTPKDSAAFSAFRSFTLTVKPDYA